MIADAIISIRGANDAARRHHHDQQSRRRPVQLLDHWLNEVEELIERNQSVVPESLIGEIGAYLGEMDPRLNRRLRSTREATGVLDVLFEAEEEFLPRTVGTA